MQIRMTERILVLGNDSVLAEVLRDVLVSEGYEVRSVSDGNAAIEAARECCPDLVLLDIDLPGRNGLALYKLLSREGIRVIVATARTHGTDRLTESELGANDCVAKPFELEELLARIRATLPRSPNGTEPLSPAATHVPHPAVVAPSISRAVSSQSVIRLLCVDPHPVALEGLTSLIAKQLDMYVVATATSGEQAIELFGTHRPDIVVLELRLPTMSGFDVIRDIRARDQGARIVVFTEYRGDEDIFMALHAGAATYVLKDSLTTELVSFIRHVHAGRTLLPGQVQAILAERSRTPPLTNRELQVIRLAATGLHNMEIAAALDITVQTVKIHIRNMLSKLGAKGRAEAIALAARRGIIRM
jgi:DNA-binding NarL/FixJ family response regulator